MTPNVYVVTMATHRDGYLPVYEALAEKFNVDLHILGLGTTWTGYASKVHHLRVFLRELVDRDPFAVVIFTDAFDVLLLQTKSTIQKEFLKFQADIVIGCDPDAPGLQAYFQWKVWPKFRDTYLCTGLYGGRCWAMLLLCEMAMLLGDLEDPTVNDQIVLPKALKFLDRSGVRIGIDNTGNLFYNAMAPHAIVYNTDIEWKFQNQRLDMNGLTPCFLHAPANGNMDPVVEHYGLESLKCMRRPQNQYLLSGFKMYYHHFWHEITLAAVITCILIHSMYKRQPVPKEYQRINHVSLAQHYRLQH